MEWTLRVDDGDRSFAITGLARDDWDGLDDPCPACGAREFDHLSTTGGHYGVRDEAVVSKSDFWDAERALLTRCRGCERTLYRHPAAELLFGPERGGPAGSER